MKKNDLPPSRTAEQFVVRLPEGMRDKISIAAKENGRSMNAEIISRLQSGDCAEVLKELRELENLYDDLVHRHLSYLRKSIPYMRSNPPNVEEDGKFLDELIEVSELLRKIPSRR